ncbi:MAG TPA: hypothetical protein VK604_15935 [Bryobacteraceae bacterium]|nr:hypothetical protein [Bryobacteraceae bacterium]
MIVVVADIAQEERVFGKIRELAGLFQGQSVLGRPPGIEMAPMVAAEPRTTPTSIQSLSRFVVEALGVHGKPLKQEGSTPPDGIPTVFRELFEKFLMTEERVCGLAGSE